MTHVKLARIDIHRRHLTPGQRAMIAETVANMREGRPKTGSKDLVSIGVSMAQAAKAGEVTP